MTGRRLDALPLLTALAPTDEVYVERLGRSRRAALALVEQLTGRKLLARHGGSGGPVDIALPAGYRALRLVGRIATTGATPGAVIVRLSADGGASFRTTLYDYSGYAGNFTLNEHAHIAPGRIGAADATAFWPYVLVDSNRNHALDLTLIDYAQADRRTQVHWHYVEDRDTTGRHTAVCGWVGVDEAHDTLRVTRTAGALGAWDLALLGYL